MDDLGSARIGSIIELGTFEAAPIEWIVVAKNHYGYPLNSVILMSKYALANVPFNSKVIKYNEQYETYYPWAMGRMDWGADGVNCQLKTWLNSLAPEGGWFQNNGDGITTPVYELPSMAYRAGFLYEWTDKEINALLEPVVRYSKVFGTENIEKFGTNITRVESATAQSKVFLPSVPEISLGLAEGGAYSGDVFEYFSIHYPEYNTKIPLVYNFDNEPVHWWLRDGYGHKMGWQYQWEHIVDKQGWAASCCNSDWDKVWVRPCICLRADTAIIEDTSMDGEIYDIRYFALAGEKATIEPVSENLDLGVLVNAFPPQQYRVYDDQTEEGTDVKLEEGISPSFVTNRFLYKAYPKLDESGEPVENNTDVFEFSIPSKDWVKVKNGSNVAFVEAHNGNAPETLCYEFFKQEDKIRFKLSNSFESDMMPTGCNVACDGIIPAGARFKVEVCNNGFDVEPAWEDITAHVYSGKKYVFLNREKQADKWGFNIRVSLDRNGVEGHCFIDELRGSFE